jgi:hypothetical protein
MTFTNLDEQQVEIDFIQPAFTQKDGEKKRENEYIINNIVIHQSFLEKLAGENKSFLKDVDDINEKLIFNLKSEHNLPSIILCSGRGRSKNEIYKYCKYVPFSIIESTLMTKTIDKLSLVNVLFKTQN